MNGYVGNTDFDWYSFLSAQQGLDEVNFWQPSGGRGFQVVTAGEPFFFRLKSPHNAIAGFGWFARHSVAPASLVWEAFGKKNGAPDLATMRRRIEKYRAVKPQPLEDYAVGCLMVAQPIFFPAGHWVEDATDWKPNIVQGKGYDVTVGEGRRILEACMARAEGLSLPSFVGAREPPAERYGAPQLVKPRLGQGIFMLSIRDAYEGACAVTSEHSMPVLEAAHIRPYADEGEHEVHNGLLLRTDIHRLFDKGYVTVTPDYRFEVSRRLKEEFDNGKTYYDLQGRQIRLPKRALERPAPSVLAWHNEQVFRG